MANTVLVTVSGGFHSASEISLRAKVDPRGGIKLTPELKLYGEASQSEDRNTGGGERSGAGVGLRWAATERLTLDGSLRTARSKEAQEVQLGEPTAIDLQLENRADLSYVAVEVPLPAGLEVLQKNIGRGQASLRIAGHTDPYVSHEELRADRVLLFADYLPAGTHHHTIYVRPTTAGTFVLPAAHAEAMYEPEIHGRTTGTTVVVK